VEPVPPGRSARTAPVRSRPGSPRTRSHTAVRPPRASGARRGP
jgi:hypothetical protein